MNPRAVLSHSSGLSSPAWTTPGAIAPDPVDLPQVATGTAGAVPPPAPATPSRESALVAIAQGTSCIRTEDGTVILFDRRTGRAVSAATRQAAEAAMQRLTG